MSSNNNNMRNNSLNNTANNLMRKGNNTMKTMANTYNKSSPIAKVIIWVVVVFIVILLIWWIVYAIKKAKQQSTENPVIIGSPIDAWETRDPIKIPNPSSGYNLSYSMWIYVRDWDYRFGKWKNIMWKGNVKSKTKKKRHSPSIWLYPLTNSIKFVTSHTGANGITSCDVENIPLQKWVHLTYVLNNRSVDIYVNGKLERTCILEGIPINNANDNLIVNYNNGFYGKMGKMQYFTRSLSPEEIVSLYMAGPDSATIFSSGQINDN
jgi:hypothetical protein